MSQTSYPTPSSPEPYAATIARSTHPARPQPLPTASGAGGSSELAGRPDLVPAPPVAPRADASKSAGTAGTAGSSTSNFGDDGAWQRAGIDFGELARRDRPTPETYQPGDRDAADRAAPQDTSVPTGASDRYHTHTIETHASLPRDAVCFDCGSPVDLHAKFCPACGEDLLDEVAAAKAGPGVDSQNADSSNTTAPETYTRSYQAEENPQLWKCDSCGSEINSRGSDRTLFCPFCESTFVAEISPHQGHQRPEFIIGFGITKEQAGAKFQTWLSDRRWYHPQDLQSAQVVQKMRGVYVPFWSFSTLATSRWSASIGEYWYRTQTYTVRDSKGRVSTRTRRVRETEWWPLSGRHHQFYSGYLVSGSRGLSQEEADAIQPYNLPALQRYQPFFLAGWYSEEYSVNAQQALERSLQVFQHWENGNIQGFMPGDTSSNLQVQTEFSQTQSDLCLFPIYMLTYRYQNQNYRVLLNGQTGKLIGTKPYWRSRITWVITWAIVLIAFLIAMAMLAQFFWKSY